MLQAQQEQTLAALDMPVVLAHGARRGAGRAGDHHRQRILRRAAGQSGGETRPTAGTSAWSGSATTARSPSRSRREPIRAFRATAAAGACATRRRRSIFEWRADTDGAWSSAAASRASGGAALVIDYGHVESALGDTLAGGRPPRFRRPADRAGRRSTSPPMSISRRWRRRPKPWAPSVRAARRRRNSCAGSASRRARAALKANAPRAEAARDRRRAGAADRPGRTGMGALFKVMAFAHPKLGMPPGFER